MTKIKKRAEIMKKDNIDEIRRNAIKGIKEKAIKIPKYLHPCNKEWQEDMNILGFANGNGFTTWMQQNGIMRRG